MDIFVLGGGLFIKHVQRKIDPYQLRIIFIILSKKVFIVQFQ